MARKVETVVVPFDNRDQGKMFQLTEMPATQAERWAMRAFMALARSGVQLPEGAEDAGMAGIATAGLKALGSIEFDEAAVLMDEMMACVKRVRDPNNPLMVFNLLEEDIEEVATRMWLRTKVFELHTGFSIAGGKLSLISTPAPQPTSSSTQTSSGSTAT